MLRPIKLWELLISLTPIIGMIIATYVSLREADTRAELRLNQLESNYQKLESLIISSQDRTDRKLEVIRDEQTTIRVLLENKENRRSK